jgi:hypothetical protein
MFFKDSTGIILLSIILGLGFASLFKKICHSDECKVIRYRTPTGTGDNIPYRVDDKCYNLVKQETTCQNDLNSPENQI